MHLKYNYKNQLEGFKWALEVYVLYLLVIVVFWYNNMIEMEDYVFVCSGIILLFLGMPLLLYHVRYYLRNRRSSDRYIR